MQQLVVGTFFVVSLIALAPMFLILRRIIQPLTTLMTAANAIAAGELHRWFESFGATNWAPLPKPSTR